MPADGPPDLAAVARTIVDANRFMTLGTADEAGRPWVSPVYYAFAAPNYDELVWVSEPEAAHSRNLAVRPQLSIVIFDSQVRPGDGQAVYMSAAARELSGADLERGIEIFSSRSLAHGLAAWGPADVTAPARLRPYSAIVSQHWVLDPDQEGDRRTPVSL